MLHDTTTSSTAPLSSAISPHCSIQGTRQNHHEAMPHLDAPYNPVVSQQALWRAVIVQALMDAACGSKKYEAIQARQEALIWLRGNSRDFATVCYYAGFEPEFVRMMVKKSLENGCKWRALPGEGKRKRSHRTTSGQQARHRR